MLYATLLATSAIFAIGGVHFARTAREVLHDRLSLLVMVMAGGFYMLAGALTYHGVEIPLRASRYADWFVTVPILLYQLFMFLKPGTSRSVLVKPIAFCVAMLVCGIVGEVGLINKWIACFVGTVCSLYCFVNLAESIKPKDYAFFGVVLCLWMFYPIVYMIPDALWNAVAFSFVDLSAKVGTSLWIQRKSR